MGAEEAPRAAHPERPRGRRSDTARFFCGGRVGEPWAQTGALGVLSVGLKQGCPPRPPPRSREPGRTGGTPSAGDDLSWLIEVDHSA